MKQLPTSANLRAYFQQNCPNKSDVEFQRALDNAPWTQEEIRAAIAPLPNQLFKEFKGKITVNINGSGF